MFVSAQEQTCFPADTFGRNPQFLQGPVLDLPHPFFADAEQMADLTQAVRAVAGQAETQVENAPFTGAQVIHQEIERFLAFGVLPERLALVIGHRFGELEVAVVVENGIQGYRGPGGSLQMRQMFEAAAGT